MIKVSKCICNKDLMVGFCFDSFTEGKIYFLRNSKKGNIVVKSDGGRWIPIPKGKPFFTLTESFYVKNLEELRNHFI